MAEVPYAAPSPAASADIHADGFLQFVHPAGFGYFNDRTRVAGFESHGFDRLPHPVAQWEVARVELIGLLLHPDPVVYLSDKLPRMDDIKDGPTRHLDPFESEGLEALRRGEDVFARAERMVGSLRSTMQCLDCHGGNRGNLLGALTYTLRPSLR